MSVEDDSNSPANPVYLLRQEVWSRGDLAQIDELVPDVHVHTALRESQFTRLQRYIAEAAKLNSGEGWYA